MYTTQGWGAKAWARAIRDQINDEVIRNLHDAVKPTVDDRGQPVPPRRKDMTEFPRYVDRFATMIVLMS